MTPAAAAAAAHHGGHHGHPPGHPHHDHAAPSAASVAAAASAAAAVVLQQRRRVCEYEMEKDLARYGEVWSVGFSVIANRWGCKWKCGPSVTAAGKLSGNRSRGSGLFPLTFSPLPGGVR